MQQTIIYLYKQIIPKVLFFPKIRALQTYPLKMNLVPKIQMDQKRNSGTLPSTLLLIPK
jgi:hypothetical protein